MDTFLNKSDQKPSVIITSFHSTNYQSSVHQVPIYTKKLHYPQIHRIYGPALSFLFVCILYALLDDWL